MLDPLGLPSECPESQRAENEHNETDRAFALD